MPASAYPRAGVPVGAGLYWDRWFALAVGFTGLAWQVGLVCRQQGAGKGRCAHTLPAQPNVVPAALHHPRQLV